MITISNHVVCVNDNFTSKRSIRSDEAFGGPFYEHKRNDFEFVKKNQSKGFLI